MTHLSDDAHIRLELAGISKAFPGCQANDNINLKVRAGEIHALLGENGAGKSTLMKIIYGLLHADKGVMRWEGDQITSPNPTAARNPTNDTRLQRAGQSLSEEVSRSPDLMTLQ